MQQFPRWKKYAAQVGVTAVILLLPQMVLGQQPASLPGEVPVGWYVYPESELKNLDETTRRCFNYSHNEWQVINEGNGVRITLRSSPKGKDDFPPVPSWPPLLKHQEGMPGRTIGAGLRSAMHLTNGWLLAYDGGEWGGGLWLTNPDGSQAKRIISENVRDIVPLDDDRILVLSGWVPTIPDYGKEYVFSNPVGLNIKLQYSTRLDGAPMATTKLPDGLVLLVTTRSLHAIRTPESHKKPEHRFPDWVKAQYPNSIVARPDGTIFIGMRMFVLRLTPNPAGYSEDWLLPNSCPMFELDEKDLDCVCKSR